MSGVRSASSVEDEADKFMSSFVVSTSDEPRQKSVEAEADALMSVNQRASADRFGSDFDSETFAGPWLRLSLARGDNLEEKRIRLRKEHAEGEIKIMEQSIVSGYDEDTLVWRESPQAQWKMIEPQGFQASDLGMDIAEAFAPSAESIAAEIGVTAAVGIASGPAAPVTVPTAIAYQAGAAMAGEAIEQGMQYLTGKQAQSLGEVGAEIGSEGMYSLIGGFAMSPFAATYNIARGAGALKVGDEGIAVIKAAKNLSKDKLGDKLTPGLVTDNPIIQLQEKQAGAVLPGFTRRYNELLNNLDDVVRSASPGNKAEAMNEVTESLKEFSDHFLGQVNLKGTSLGKAGKTLQEGVEQYSKASKKAVSALYDEARKIEDPIFDFDPFVSVSKDLKAGAKGKLDPALAGPIAEFNAIRGPKKLPSGKVLSVTDQIRNVRTELYDLKQVVPGEKGSQLHTGQANDLYKAVNEILQTPQNADPRFLKAWSAANDASRIRSDTIGQAAVMSIARSETPYKLAAAYARPGEVDNLLAIRKTVPPKHWAEFQDAAYGEILKDPSKARATFDAFDQETLDALMPRQTQKLFREVTGELERITSVGADSLKELQVTNRNFVDSLITGGNPRQSITIMRASRGPKNKGLRDSLRASIVDWAWDGVIEHTGRGVKANASVLKSRIEKLKRTNFWNMLSTKEKRLISDAHTVSKAFQRVQDAGTSIQGATVAKGIIPAILTADLKSNAFTSVFQFGLTSRLYLSDTGRRAMIGGGLQNSNGALLRAFGGALTQMSVPEDISSYAEESN